MTNMVASSQTCTAMFSALVVSLKENGLKAEDHTNDKDFDPDEKLVATYLRLRLELRTDSNIQNSNVKSNTENHPDNILDYVESHGNKLETDNLSDQDPTHGLEPGIETVFQPDTRSENGKPDLAKELNTPKSNKNTADVPQTQHQSKQLKSLAPLPKSDVPANTEDTSMSKKTNRISKSTPVPSTTPKPVSLSPAQTGKTYKFRKDLWTSIASDQIAPNAKSDESFKKMGTAAFMVAASKRGRSHALHGTYRDDHFELSCNNGWHIMAVADGAGSARLSREGSRIACQVVLDELKKNLPEKIDSETQNMIEKILKSEGEKERRSNTIVTPVTNSLIDAVKSAACKLEQYANELNCNVTDLSTTLAIAIARKIENHWFLLSFSIGDGGIAVWDDKANEVKLMCRPDSGEFAGQTRFISCDDLGSDTDCISRIFIEVCSDFSAFLAMTDGITDPKFETDSELANPERWRDFWNDLTSKVDFSRNNNTLDKQFLDWMDFWSRGNHDDRTLAVLLPKDINLSKKNESVRS